MGARAGLESKGGLIVQSPETAKPATAETVNGLRKIEQLGSGLNSQNSGSPRDRQVLLLSRRFALSIPMAGVIASLYFGEGAR